MKDFSNKRAMLAEKVRNLIIQTIHDSIELPSVNYSEYISRQLCVNYTLLSKSFSRYIGTTIEQFIIIQKIERVKEMISQTELTLSEISWKLRYSSPAHLSAQFKRITGIAPSVFRKIYDKQGPQTGQESGPA